MFSRLCRAASRSGPSTALHDEALDRFFAGSYGGEYEQAIMHAFHSSLAPDGDLYCVESVAPADQELVQRQARQLLRD